MILTTLVLFSLLMAGFMNITMANPIWTSYFPIDPIKTQPNIMFQSPQQSQTYNSQAVWLNFTITKPASWYVITNQVTDQTRNPAYFNLVNITSVGYIIDEKQNTSLPVCDISRFYEFFPNTQLNFSVSLPLSEGTHTVRVWYKADSFYPQTDYYTSENHTQAWPAGTRNYYDSVSASPLEGSSDLINFSTAPSGSFPTTVVLLIVTVLIIVILLLFFIKKFSHRSADNH